ncbi:MAG TPA: hypothetical protein VEW04_06580 [Allosphingosinicella sp.]|nr:hypothetical protein [Allosphingosinicella sp.]
MKYLAFLLLALPWAGPLSAQGAADRGRSGCVAGPSEPSIPPLRPHPVAICSYGPAEFHARIDRLLAVREGRLGIEEVERIFSLPRVTTTYDNPRSTYFGIILHSAPERETWSAQISVQERYGPDLESRPVRFRGSGRPVRINPRERGDIFVNVALMGPTGLLAPDQPFCLPVAALGDAALRHGWMASMIIRMPSLHAPRDLRSMDLSRGGLSLSTSFRDENECVRDFMLSQSGDPPTQPMTEAEDAARRRDFAVRMGDVLEQAILAQPAQGHDGEEARRAYARLMRDSSIQAELREPDDWNSLIDSMSPEQLRDLARRAVSGHYWGANQEYCMIGIREGDVRAALARIARERGWNAAERQALESACSIFLQGRRYRSNNPSQP